jgi:hypothetical protein
VWNLKKLRPHLWLERERLLKVEAIDRIRRRVESLGKARVGPDDTVVPTPNEHDYGQAIESILTSSSNILARAKDHATAKAWREERSRQIEDEAFRVMHRRLARTNAINSIIENLDSDATIQDLCDKVTEECGGLPFFNRVPQKVASVEEAHAAEVAMWKERAEGNKTAMLVCVRERDEAREELERFTTNVLGQTHMPVAMHTRLMEEQVKMYQASHDHVAAELQAMTIDRDLFKSARTRLLEDVKMLTSLLAPDRGELTGEVLNGVVYTSVKVRHRYYHDEHQLEVSDSDGDPVRRWDAVDGAIPVGTKVRVGGVFSTAVVGEVTGHAGDFDLMIVPGYDSPTEKSLPPERWSALSVEGMAL